MLKQTALVIFALSAMSALAVYVGYQYEKDRPQYFSALYFTFSNRAKLSVLEQHLSSRPEINDIRPGYVPRECDDYPFKGECIEYRDEAFEFWSITNDDWTVENNRAEDWEQIRPQDVETIRNNLFHPTTGMSYLNLASEFSIHSGSSDNCGERRCRISIVYYRDDSNRQPYCRTTSFPHEIVECIYSLYSQWHIRYFSEPKIKLDPETGLILNDGTGETVVE